MKYTLSYIFLVTALLCTSALNGQHKYVILDQQERVMHDDSLTCILQLDQRVATYQKMGHLLADYTYLQDDTTYHYTIDRGDVYSYGNVHMDSATKELTRDAGLAKYLWESKTPSDDQVSQYMQKLLYYLDRNGYPFAKSQLTDIAVDNQKINGTLHVDKGPYVTWDSLIVNGNITLRKSFLRKHLSLDKGLPFDVNTFQNIEKKLNELPYIKTSKSPEVRFYDTRATVKLFLEEEKTNRFDFIIGVLPSTTNGDRSFTITGEFTAELSNQLGQGEYIYVSLENLRPQVQELDVSFIYPYIMNLPLGISSDLRVYRRQEEFIEVIGELGLDFSLQKNLYLQTSWVSHSSRLIDIDTESILQSQALPTNLDVTKLSGRLGVRKENLDYKWNPSRGYSFKIESSLGQRKVIPNTIIQDLKDDEVDFATSYDTISLKTIQVELSLNAEYYYTLTKYITWKNQLRGSILLSEDNIFENEYYRIGGNRILRGQDEQSVLAQGYALWTSELRLLLNQNSYLTLPFLDYGYTQIRDDNNLTWDRVIGVGMGINFATPAGIFNVAFASGQRLGNSFNFGNPKVHFGYVNLF